MEEKIRKAAIRAGIVDLDALRMVDTSNVKNARQFIDDLKVAKPYLFPQKRTDVWSRMASWFGRVGVNQ